MRAVVELAARYAAARGVAAPADTQAAAYIADVQAGREGVGTVCRGRGWCVEYDEFTRSAHLPKVCEDCGAPVHAGAAA